MNFEFINWEETFGTLITFSVPRASIRKNFPNHWSHHLRSSNGK